MQSHEITAMRHRYGMSQQHLARELGLTVTSISRWEQGKVTPPLWLRTWFAGHFGENAGQMWRLHVCDDAGRVRQGFDRVYGSRAEALAAAERINEPFWSYSIYASTLIVVLKNA